MEVAAEEEVVEEAEAVEEAVDDGLLGSRMSGVWVICVVSRLPATSQWYVVGV